MDIIKSFMLADGLVRGSFIAADDVVAGIWDKQGYPDVLKPILTDVIIMALTLSAGIKYEGIFSLQIKGDGVVGSVFADVTHDRKVRAYAVFDAEKLPEKADTLSELVGKAQMIFSVGAVGADPYQGVVAVTQDTLVEAVSDYFRLSEQIPTHIVFRRQGDKARVVMIQEMPDKPGVSEAERADVWETVQVLADSVQDAELFDENLTPDDILFRLFHANGLVVFPAQTPLFECRCYRSRMQTFLTKMKAGDRKALYHDGIIKTTCQFCGEEYDFTPAEFGDVID